MIHSVACIGQLTMTTHSFNEANLQALIEKIANDEDFKKPTFHITSATKPDEKFVSRLFRVSIIDENKEGKSLSVILKASSPCRARQVATSSNKLFRTESEMYSIVFPALTRFLGEHGISDAEGNFPNTARCFGWDLNDGTRENEADVLVLEDKKLDGFFTVDVGIGFDVDHCALILEKLALFHASFMALRVLDPEKAERFQNLIYKRLWINDPTHPTLNDLKQAAIVGLSMLSEPYVPGQPVYDTVLKLVEDFANEHVKMNEVPQDVSVIAHGDCWSNNILCRNNENGRVVQICLVDFQLSRACSPVVDLMYVLLMCTTKETRDKHYDFLIMFYFDYIHQILRRFGCDPEAVLPWNRLQKHLKLYGKVGLMFSLVALPVFMSQRSADFDSGDDNSNMFSDRATTKSDCKKRISKRLNDLVTDCARWGYI